MDEPVLEFVVQGRAEPGGSKSARVVTKKDGSIVYKDGKPLVIVKDANDNVGAWRDTVAWTARSALPFGHEPWDEPLVLHVTIYRKRPAGHYGTGRNAGILKDWAVGAYPTVAPDLLKQVRAIEDAMTDVVYVDDSRIVEERIRQFFGRPRVHIAFFRADPAIAAEVAQQEGTGVPQAPPEQGSLLAA